MITIQKYVRAQSLEEAWQLNQNKRNRILGGMLWTRLERGTVNTAIDLCDLGLNTIEETEDQFSIGAMVSLRDIEQHEGLHAYSNGAVRKALEGIVGVQFRNMATVGGSIWGRFGFSDVLTVFLAMDAYVELYKGGIIPLSAFVTMKYDRDVLVRIIVKKTNGKFAYQYMRNQSTDFPVLTCCVSQLNGTYRAVIGARPARAMLIEDSKHILSEGVTAEAAKQFAQYVAGNVPTSSNLRGSGEYRSHLARVLTQRAVMELGGLK